MPSAQEIAGRMRSRTRGLINRLGYDFHRLRQEPPATERQPPMLPTADEAAQFLLNEGKPRVVIDVGANVGQFASWVRDAGFTREIISFEPQPKEHAALEAAADSDPAWTVAPRCALGAATGTAQIHVAGKSLSSSLLEMLDLHSENAPTSAYADAIDTPVRTLDEALAELDFEPTGALLKIDTRRFEAEVLRVAAGLELTIINDCFNTGDGQILQIDGGFTRMGESKKPA